MIVFILIQLLLLIGGFLFWYFDPIYFNVGFVLYHTYPVFFFILAFLFRKKVDEYSYLPKISAIIVPMALWMSGVFYIYQYHI